MCTRNGERAPDTRHVVKREEKANAREEKSASAETDLLTPDDVEGNV